MIDAARNQRVQYIYKIKKKIKLNNICKGAKKFNLPNLNVA